MAARYYTEAEEVYLSPEGIAEVLVVVVVVVAASKSSVALSDVVLNSVDRIPRTICAKSEV